MNKGTLGYTEYDYDGEFTKFLKSKVNGDMKKFVELLKQKNKNRISHIHSHNNMKVFFSGTDTKELLDNSEHYNYYLSLIVNNNHEMCAKIAYRGFIKSEGERKTSIKYKDINGDFITINEEENFNSKEEEVVFIVDCDIKSQYSISEEFKKRTDFIIEEAEKKAQKIKAENIKKFSIDNYSSFGKLPESNRAFVNSNQLKIFENIDSDIDSDISDKDIKQFISKVISFDLEDTLGIESNLTQIQHNIDANQIDMDEYIEKLEEQIFLAFTHCFGELYNSYELFEIICERASDIIDEYETQFPFVDIISHEFWNISQTQLDK